MIYCKHIAICITRIAKITEEDTKLIKLVLHCAKFKLNAAIVNNKAKLNTKQ